MSLVRFEKSVFAYFGIVLCICTVGTNVDFLILGRPRMTLPITQVANIDIGIAQCICTVGINVDFQILGRPRIKLPITQVANNGIGMD